MELNSIEDIVDLNYLTKFLMECLNEVLNQKKT